MRNRYLPHTSDDTKDMLAAIGVSSVDDLFQDIPDELRLQSALSIPGGLSEPEVMDWARQLASQNVTLIDRPVFLGAGFYRRHIPPAVDEIVHRGEFYTAYTPYQPEISQGTLQALYEYQSVVARLAGMDAAHSSSYDGGTALADGLRMALSLTPRKKVVISRGIHPEYRVVLETYMRYLDVEFVDAPLKKGITDIDFVMSALDEHTGVFVVQNPNFLGYLEPQWPEMAARAQDVGAKVLYSGDPIAMAVLAAPGHLGADIVTGEGQPLGIPLQFGGPGFGFLATRKDYIYHMPGRVVGRTVDDRGQTCYVMTLRFREQDVRRHRATSNLCTNNSLMALRALAYVLLMGADGLREVATLSASMAQYAKAQLEKIGVQPYSDSVFLWEFPVVLDVNPGKVNRALLKRGIIGGLPLNRHVTKRNGNGKPFKFYEYLGIPELENGWLLAFTELTTREHIDALVDALRVIL